LLPGRFGAEAPVTAQLKPEGFRNALRGLAPVGFQRSAYLLLEFQLDLVMAAEEDELLFCPIARSCWFRTRTCGSHLRDRRHHGHKFGGAGAADTLRASALGLGKDDASFANKCVVTNASLHPEEEAWRARALNRSRRGSGVWRLPWMEMV